MGKMDNLEFVDLREELEKNHIAWDSPACCSSKESSYSLLRAQIQGTFQFSRDGVWIKDSEHDKKCLSLLRLAKQKSCDLVLFPEYCISDQVLWGIVSDESLWPENRKLWVLPCQGMTKDKFQAFIEDLSKNNRVFLLNTACTSRRVTFNHFVTVLFYCFLGYQGDSPILCLVPQLKTQPMGDQECLCEQAGMATGSVIFTLEQRLLTLLCADSMNNELTWQTLQENGLLMSGLTILHPQLNGHPKDPVFSRLRWELFERGKPGVYITCNWAAGTTLSPPECQEPTKTIDLSWSCLYLKYADDIFEKWERNYPLRRDNEAYGLFGAIMKPKRTEVWFSLSQEEVLELRIPNLDFNGYGKLSVPDIHAQARLCYDQGTRSWMEQATKSETLQQRINQLSQEHLYLRQNSCAIDNPYRFPLDTTERWDADRFFALALEASPNNILEIDEKENLIAWTLLLNEGEQETAGILLEQLLSLINILQGEFLPQCAPLKAPHSFCYQPAQPGKPSINLQTKEQGALVAYAQTTLQAQKHVKFLRETECYRDEDLLRQFVRVFYYEPRGHKLACVPMLSTEITQGRGTIMKGDITDGGSESDV